MPPKEHGEYKTFHSQQLHSHSAKQIYNANRERERERERQRQKECMAFLSSNLSLARRASLAGQRLPPMATHNYKSMANTIRSIRSNFAPIEPQKYTTQTARETRHTRIGGRGGAMYSTLPYAYRISSVVPSTRKVKNLITDSLESSDVTWEL